MSIFSAHDLQAADLLALAWLDDNGAPCPAAGPPDLLTGRRRHRHGNQALHRPA
jgi:hypothetical protein